MIFGKQKFDVKQVEDCPNAELIVNVSNFVLLYKFIKMSN